MKFKVGDKVKFLNDVGGGIIKKIISPTMVSVSIEDGFDVPVMMNEILLAESSDVQGAVFNQTFSLSNTIPETSIQEDEFMDRITALQKFSSLNPKPHGIYLAYIPQDQVWLMKDDIDIFIVNYTSFEILYSLIIENENTFKGIDYGSVPPFSKVHIQTVSRDELETWLNGFVQVLFFKEDNPMIKMPLHAPFKVKLIRFLKKDAYLATNFMAEKGVLIYLGQSVSALGTQQIEWKKEEGILQNSPTQSTQIITHEKFIDKYKIDRNTAEVDLHIETILDDHDKLDNTQILLLQRRLFIQCMESAIEGKLQKVIFIHGVGSGTLKKEIITVLQQYPNVHYFDASMQKYGRGAIEVLIKS
ncbi:MAG: DUF2027 domain-containing protein [Bacteroidales bacterium]|jgi:hypothetical protein|nr:DUF2027 domain-containing protein [Bacteroidales bacterium]